MTSKRVAIDIGGTFTDIAVLTNDGAVRTFKVSTDAAAPEQAVKSALARLVMSGDADQVWEHVLHGTTVGTNAMLEKRLPRVVLITTEGFRDVLQIRRSKRAELYSMAWTPEEPLVPRDLIFELRERTAPDGSVWIAMAEADLKRAVDWVREVQPDSVAVCLLQSHMNDEHERRVEAALREAAPDLPVTLSSAVSPELGEYERTSTTVVHAAMKPIMSEYLTALQQTVDGRLLVMQSNGGLGTAAQIISAPASAIESGPAAGALAAGFVARAAGIDKAIAFDVGGTTAKTCLLEGGTPAETSELRVGGEMHAVEGFRDAGGHAVRGRAIDLVEVGAGGGSLCVVDDHGVLHVGPESAGADPGPVAYGRGGTVPTVTDANLVLGFLRSSTAADVVLDSDRARAAIGTQLAEPLGVSVEEAAWLVFQVANSNMLRALQAVTSERGRDPVEFTLVAFGGGGPTHAAAMAHELGLAEVLIPANADCLSAVGLHACAVRKDVQRPVHRGLATVDEGDLEQRFTALVADVEAELRADQLDLDGVAAERMLDLRFTGQSSFLTVPAPEVRLGSTLAAAARGAFLVQHRFVYGHADDEAAVELVAIRVRMNVPLSRVEGLPRPALVTSELDDERTRAFFGPEHGWLETRRVPYAALLGGKTVEGPVLVQLAQATAVVPPGDSVRVDEVGNVRVSLRRRERAAGDAHGRGGLELFRNRLGAVLDRMAFTIARTAYSSIVCDAHDFSVAIGDRNGRVIDQGVGSLMHLGSVPSALASIRSGPLWPLEDGDIVLFNDPYSGGTHLPDCIVIAPVFVGSVCVAHTVAIAHMSDIGGAAVASSFATGPTELIQEGVIIPPLKLYRLGELNRGVLDLLVRNVRSPVEFAGDLHGLVAATRSGAAQIGEVARGLGSAEWDRLADELVAYSAERGRAELGLLGDAEATFVDYLDDDGAGGEPVRIELHLQLEDGEVWADFRGSSPQRRSGINATLSTTRSVVQYCIRTLMSEDFPDNAGFHDLIHVSAEPRTVVDARDDHPVTNRSSTAFRVQDCMFGALAQMYPGKVWAAFDGATGPVGFGGRRDDGRWFTTIDTFWGASGARPWADGLQGVCPAMGNGRNMSIEAQESRFPLRFHRFGFRPNSGGAGRFRGGNGIIRHYELLCDSAEVFVRTDRQKFRPWGLEGGEPGAPGRAYLQRADGSVQPVEGKVVVTMRRGDQLVYEGPGGGGYGDPATRPAELIERDLRLGHIDDADGDAPGGSDAGTELSA